MSSVVAASKPQRRQHLPRYVRRSLTRHAAIGVILRNVDDVVQQRRGDRRPRLDVARQTHRPIGHAKQVPEIVRGVGVQSLLDLGEYGGENGVSGDEARDGGRGMRDGGLRMGTG